MAGDVFRNLVPIVRRAKAHTKHVSRGRHVAHQAHRQSNLTWKKRRKQQVPPMYPGKYGQSPQNSEWLQYTQNNRVKF